MRKLWKIMLLLALTSCFCFGAQAENLAVERTVYDYLTETMGLPSASACGILANIEHESGFNVTVVGDNGTSYGLCQWHAGRYSELKNYCGSHGLDYRTVEGQMDFLFYELSTSYSQLFTSLRLMEDTSNGAYKAAYLWCTQFERPADMENKAVSRGVLAKGKYWNRYNGVTMVAQEEEPLSQEEVLRVITQTEVTIPQPPRDADSERYEDEGKQILSLSPYIPRHRPKEEPCCEPAGAFASAITFSPMYWQEEKKKEDLVPVLEQNLAAA